jgi:hypothetical protein
MMKTSHLFTISPRLQTFCAVFALAAGCSVMASAQALPAAEASPISTGFALPTHLGSLRYGISGSQSLLWGYYGESGVSSATSVSGDLAYLSDSKLHPFSLVATGGHSFGERGEPSNSFFGLGFSQVANIGRWGLVVSDNLSYLPGTASPGLSGVAGQGDLGVNPIQITGDSTQGLLTNYANRINNIVALGVSRQLTGKTSVSASGNYTTLKFIDTTLNNSNQSTAGLDSTSETGQGGLQHQVDSRNSFGASYGYSKYSYSNNNFGIIAPGFASQDVAASYGHHFSPRLSVSLSGGPQWTTIQTATNVTSTSVFVDASGIYDGKFTNFGLTFVRSTNNGYGTLGGGLSNGVTFSASHRFGIVWNVAASANFSQTSSLAAVGIPEFTAETNVDGVQMSRALRRNLSGYASYTYQRQNTSGLGAISTYSGTSQIIGIGITYSPDAIRLGH